jgi:hypothetical protein
MNESIKEGMYIIPTTCYKCEQPMNVAIIQRNNGSFCGPEAFSVEEKSIAKNHGVIIEDQYSQDKNVMMQTLAHIAIRLLGNIFYLMII